MIGCIIFCTRDNTKRKTPKHFKFIALQNFSSDGDVNITSEGLHFLFAFTPQLWLLSNRLYSRRKPPMALTPIAKRLAAELSLPVLMT